MINTTGCDNVLLVKLDHAMVNALDLELLHEHIDAYDAAPANCPVVLTGARQAHVEVAENSCIGSSEA